jgi:3-hydroxyisobutyrate dehydrogenase-like beta-hydroxyacid dehydrogenase
VAAQLAPGVFEAVEYVVVEYDAKVATPENLAVRVATMELALSEALAVIKTIGATQGVLGDALREHSARMGSVESMAQDTNQRTRSLEESIAEIKDLLVQALDR